MRYPIVSRVAVLTLLMILASVPAHAGATLTILNNDGPGEGFNDPTPKAPLGGNAGTTVGQQRLIAFARAASIWGSSLDSNVPIVIRAQFNPQTCTPTSAVLGSASAFSIFANFVPVGFFPGPEFTNTWYHSSLADKRAGAEVNPTPNQPDINTTFNSNLNGNPACLGGRGWYYGLDANHGTDIDLIAVLLHEFAHGLGFSQFASVTNGSMPLGLTDVYGRRLLDLTTGLMWNQMTNAQRIASAINSRRVVWTGEQVTAAVPSVLSLGTPLLRVNSPAAISGVYAVGTAEFGAPLSSPGVTAALAQAIDADEDGAGTAATDKDGCSAISTDLTGKIGLVDRGVCTFVVKAKNVQNAGAVGMVVANNPANPGAPPAGMAGVDPTVTIPSVLITLSDGNTIKAQLGGGVNVTLGVDSAVFAGTDPAGRALMNAPNPVQPGSSISHWDPIAFRNQLMEPSINGDLTHSVKPPQDLTLPQMRDVGWFQDGDVDGVAEDEDACPLSNREPVVTIAGCNTGVANTLLATGCTINDLIAKCAGANTPGGVVSCIAKAANDLRLAGVIATSDSIIACALGNAFSGIDAELAAMIAPDPKSKLADKIEDVLSKLRQASGKRNSGDLQGALGELEGAVGDLEAAVKDGLLSAAVGRRLLNEMAGVARTMAQQEIDKAVARGASASKVNEANSSLSAGDNLLGSGKYKDACGKYKDALSKAQGA